MSRSRRAVAIMRFGIPGHLPGQVPDPGSRAKKMPAGNGIPFPVLRNSLPACTGTLNENLNGCLNENLNATTLRGAFRTFLRVQS